MSLAGPVPAPLVDEVAHRFRVLGDPTRLRLLNALHAEGELSVGELAERAGASLANASKHLALLERERLLARRRNGTAVIYRIADPTLATLCEVVCAGLRQRYAELARLGGAA
jgi:DNA-binding transcriptional ArsR family regulator